MAHFKRLTEEEIDQIIKESESTYSETWEEATEFKDDLDFYLKQIKQKGKIEIEEI